MEFKITKEQVEKLLNYLASKPWLEVQNLIQEFSNLSKFEEKKEKEDKKTNHLK